MTQLFLEAVRHNINGLVQIMAVIFRVNIGPRKSQMNFDHKSVLGYPRIVVPESNVRPDQVQPEMFQTFDSLRYIRMDGRSQFNITRTDMNLHTLSYLHLFKLSMRVARSLLIP